MIPIITLGIDVCGTWQYDQYLKNCCKVNLQYLDKRAIRKTHGFNVVQPKLGLRLQEENLRELY